MNPAKRFVNYISGKPLRELQEAGISQQRKIRDYPALNKHLFRRDAYKKEIDVLKDIDKEYSRQKKNLALSRTALAVPAVYGGAQVLEKNATSRLLQILKGTRKNELTKQVKKLEGIYGKRSTKPGFEAISKKDINKLQSLKEEAFKEKALTWGARGAAVGLPAILAKNQFKKEASTNTAIKKILPYAAGFGVAGGVGRVVVDKDMENSPANLATSATIGAGIGAAPIGLAALMLKYPKIRSLVQQKNIVKL